MAKAKARKPVRTINRRHPNRWRALPTAKTKARARPAQRFVASHYKEDDFDSGLRSYAQYRDLGFDRATSGMVRAHVIRFIPPCRPEVVSKRHYHEVDFQMVYVLKGWIKTEFKGQGVVMMRTGSSWIQPPRVEHAVLDYSDDCELLEVILPADFKTVEID